MALIVFLLQRLIARQALGKGSGTYRCLCFMAGVIASRLVLVTSAP